MTGGSPFRKRYVVIVLLTVFNSNPHPISISRWNALTEGICPSSAVIWLDTANLINGKQQLEGGYNEQAPMLTSFNGCGPRKYTTDALWNWVSSEVCIGYGVALHSFQGKRIFLKF